MAFAQGPTPRSSLAVQRPAEPFAPSLIHLRLTAVFSNLPETGSSINALLSFNPQELKWIRGPDGRQRARVDVAAAVHNETGVALAPFNATFALKMTPQP